MITSVISSCGGEINTGLTSAAPLSQGRLRRPKQFSLVLNMPSLRPLLRPSRCLVAPGIFDHCSARILSRTPGVEAAYMTGFGVSASLFGLPDAGLATYSDFISAVRGLCAASSVPVICDADTGFGGLLNVRQTVRGYQNAGAAAIQIEDQVFPKKCGHVAGRSVVAMGDMVKKIKVAVEARGSSEMVVIARTDARTTLGLDEAIRRGEAYARAGADMIFVESPESEAELEKIGRTLKGIPLVANMVEGGRTPVLGRERLAELGFQLAIYPASGFLSVTKTLETMYGHILKTGSSLDAPVGVYDFEKMTELMGLDEAREFEAKWSESDSF